jgi:hypothetical protein
MDAVEDRKIPESVAVRRILVFSMHERSQPLFYYLKKQKGSGQTI